MADALGGLQGQGVIAGMRQKAVDSRDAALQALENRFATEDLRGAEQMKGFSASAVAVFLTGMGGGDKGAFNSAMLNYSQAGGKGPMYEVKSRMGQKSAVKTDAFTTPLERFQKAVGDVLSNIEKLRGKPVDVKGHARLKADVIALADLLSDAFSKGISLRSESLDNCMAVFDSVLTGGDMPLGQLKDDLGDFVQNSQDMVVLHQCGLVPFLDKTELTAGEFKPLIRLLTQHTERLAHLGNASVLDGLKEAVSNVFMEKIMPLLTTLDYLTPGSESNGILMAFCQGNGDFLGVDTATKLKFLDFVVENACRSPIADDLVVARNLLFEVVQHASVGDMRSGEPPLGQQFKDMMDALGDAWYGTEVGTMAVNALFEGMDGKLGVESGQITGLTKLVGSAQKRADEAKGGSVTDDLHPEQYLRLSKTEGAYSARGKGVAEATRDRFRESFPFPIVPYRAVALLADIAKGGLMVSENSGGVSVQTDRFDRLPKEGRLTYLPDQEVPSFTFKGEPVKRDVVCVDGKEGAPALSENAYDLMETKLPGAFKNEARLEAFKRVSAAFGDIARAGSAVPRKVVSTNHFYTMPAMQGVLRTLLLSVGESLAAPGYEPGTDRLTFADKCAGLDIDASSDPMAVITYSRSPVSRVDMLSMYQLMAWAPSSETMA